VIYIDSSIVLAYLLAETNAPASTFWDAALVSSRLLAYEVWNRLHARSASQVQEGGARVLLSGIQLIALSEPVLARALEPWPTRIRTLDALHLATVEYLRRHGEAVELASYDRRLLAAAHALAIPIAGL
jgi:predicted nucleic acid-binding protein